MKKNITINLCGRLFQIDEDAYELLQQYIDSLRSSFGRQVGGDEIVDDIEARIAELFDELRQQGTEAITIDHVKDIISRIGEPEQLAGEEDAQSDQMSDNTSHKSTYQGRERTGSANPLFEEGMRSRKYFRDPRDKIIAGVLSGLSKTYGGDVTLWRLGYILLTLFTSYIVFPLFHLFHAPHGIAVNFLFVLLYIILAIVMPEARTPEQVLQMEGKPVTPQNLADTVMENREPVRQRGCLGTMLSVLLKIILGFTIGLVAIICIALLIALVGAVVAVIAALVSSPLSGHLPFDMEQLGLLDLYHSHPTVLIVFVVALFMLLLIPIYAIIHMIFSLAKKAQPMSLLQRIVWILLWIAALCCLVPCSITIGEHCEKYHKEQYNAQHTWQGVVMSDADREYLRKGDWTLLKHENCAHFTYSGQYYNGDPDVRYLDAYDEDCREVYQAERKEAVTPGIYRLDCLARAEGPGPCIYAIADGKSIVQIPVYGDKGGELVNMIQKQKADTLTVGANKQRTTVSMNIMGLKFEFYDDDMNFNDDEMEKLRIKEGYGWSIVSIDNIKVTGDSIAYGVSTDAAFTGQPCRAKWFSACDFVLTRTGDLPK